MGTDGIAHRADIDIRQERFEHSGDFGERMRRFSDKGAGGSENIRDVKVAAAPFGNLGGCAFKHGLEGGAETAVIGGSELMKGGSNPGGLDDFVAVDEAG